MLMANLASLNRIIVPFQLPALEEADVGPVAGHDKSRDMAYSTNREDVGEAVARDNVTGKERREVKPVVVAPSYNETTSTAKRPREVLEASTAETSSAKVAKKKKKQRKTGNDIDDLFSGLF